MQQILIPIFFFYKYSFSLFFIFSIKYLLNGGGAGVLFSIEPFWDHDGDFNALVGVIPILCFTFLGFDAITALSEETKDPKKTIPRAIYAIPLIGGFLYIAASYLLHMVYPNINAIVNPDSAYLEIVYAIGGIFLNSAFVAVGLTAGFASAVASGSSAARILYAMGRENVLPKRIFGYISPKFHTPIYNLLIVALVTMTALVFSLDIATSFITFGALFAFIFVNLSVINYFFMKKGMRSTKGIIKYLIIPFAGALLVLGLLLSLEINALILGGSWLIVGFSYLLFQTKLFKLPPPQIFEKKDEMSG